MTSNKKWEEINEGIYINDSYSRYEDVHKFILDQVPHVEEKLNILDIGCGDGLFLLKIPGSNNLFGVDVVESQLRKAAENGIKTSRVNIDDEPLPFENDFFDIAMASEVVEHLLVPDDLFKEAYRILKPGGKLIVSTPNVVSLGRRLMFLFGKQAFLEASPYEEHAVGHLRYFTANSLMRLAERYGFKSAKVSSDIINFDPKGKIKSRKLAKLFPTFGRTLLYTFQK